MLTIVYILLVSVLLLLFDPFSSRYDLIWEHLSLKIARYDRLSTVVYHNIQFALICCKLDYQMWANLPVGINHSGGYNYLELENAYKSFTIY